MSRRNDMVEVFARGERADILLVMSPATDITGWTFEMTIKEEPDDELAELIQLTSPTIEDVLLGKATFTLTKTQTLSLVAGVEYDYDVWRTNTSNERRLSHGLFQLLERVAEF